MCSRQNPNLFYSFKASRGNCKELSPGLAIGTVNFGFCQFSSTHDRQKALKLLHDALHKCLIFLCESAKNERERMKIFSDLFPGMQLHDEPGVAVCVVGEEGGRVDVVGVVGVADGLAAVELPVVLQPLDVLVRGKVVVLLRGNLHLRQLDQLASLELGRGLDQERRLLQFVLGQGYLVVVSRKVIRVIYIGTVSFPK